MYTRRFYRQVPPGYSGVAFGGAKESPSPPFEEDRALAAGQRGVHQSEKRRMAPLGVSFEGQKLAPILQGEEGGADFVKETLAEPIGAESVTPESVSKESMAKLPDTSREDLVLIGALLFLLGMGLDEESVLIMLCVLILLS